MLRATAGGQEAADINWKTELFLSAVPRDVKLPPSLEFFGMQLDKTLSNLFQPHCWTFFEQEVVLETFWGFFLPELIWDPTWWL